MINAIVNFVYSTQPDIHKNCLITYSSVASPQAIVSMGYDALGATEAILELPYSADGAIGSLNSICTIHYNVGVDANATNSIIRLNDGD